jgi:manganese/zinc/iron transport system permease protein
MTDFWILLVGSLVAVSCSLLGCFLILRRMAMIGDAISHAVLPGIVIAFLISGSRESVPMLIGAGLLGVFSTFLIEFFHTKARLQSDAAIGITFTWLFALGIILISAFAGQVDLDQDCVLYGEIAYVPIDLLFSPSGESLGPKAVWVLGITLVIIIFFIVTFYKELFITTFDPAFALSIGYAVTLWHYLLMGVVSLTTVAAFESVGAILVVAFLIVPAATAYLLTHRLKTMLWLSSLLGILATGGGYLLALWLNGSITGAIATVSGVMFAIAMALKNTILKKSKTSSSLPYPGQSPTSA